MKLEMPKLSHQTSILRYCCSWGTRAYDCHLFVLDLGASCHNLPSAWNWEWDYDGHICRYRHINNLSCYQTFSQIESGYTRLRNHNRVGWCWYTWNWVRFLHACVCDRWHANACVSCTVGETWINYIDIPSPHYCAMTRILRLKANYISIYFTIASY